MTRDALSPITAENWQAHVLDTATYPRPASDTTIHMLTNQMVTEFVETYAPLPSEPKYARFAVLMPPEHDKYFPQAPLAAYRSNPAHRKAVAGDLADVTWYQVALLAEKAIDMPEVLAMGGSLLLNDADLTSIDDFHQAAAGQKPTGSLQGITFDLDNTAPVVYPAAHMGPFIRAVDPWYGQKNASREHILRTSAALLWATCYLLGRYCKTNLTTAITDNYQKLARRSATGVAHGENAEDPRWQ